MLAIAAATVTSVFVLATLIVRPWAVELQPLSAENADTPASAERVPVAQAEADAAEDEPDATLPADDSVQVPETGSGKVTPVAVPGRDTATVAGARTVRYSVETEGGLPVDDAEFGAKVRATLQDSRGWQTQDDVHFVYVPPAQASSGDIDVHIILASPELVDRWCAPLQTRGQVSCHNEGRVMVNVRRWMLGAASYGDNLDLYRTYLVNHEVGHAIGHRHQPCPKAGAKAPVMLQQTLGLGGCRAWPYPVSES